MRRCRLLEKGEQIAFVFASIGRSDSGMFLKDDYLYKWPGHRPLQAPKISSGFMAWA